MQNSNRYFYQQAVNSVMGANVKIVRQPVICGTNHKILVAENDTGDKTVFRFNDRNTAHRNHDIAMLMKAYNVPAPRTELHMYQGQYFETYPYITGKTLQEQLDTGILPEHHNKIYTSIAYKFKQIASIPTFVLRNIKNPTCHQVAQANVLKKTNSRILGSLVRCATAALNGGNHVVCHCDLTPQNIIMNDNKDITAILDLNAISVANINFAIAITGLSLEKNNLDKNEFYRVCSEIIPTKICDTRIRLAEHACRLYFAQYTKQKSR